MAKLGIVALLLVGVCQITSGLESSSVTPRTITSEQHIKEIVTNVRDKCSSCKDKADIVLSRTVKDDICDAFYTYKGCMLIPCYSQSTGSEMKLGEEICDGGNFIHVSVLAVLMATIIHCLV